MMFGVRFWEENEYKTNNMLLCSQGEATGEGNDGK